MSVVALALNALPEPLRRLDRVVLALALAFAVLAVLTPDQALASLGFTVENLIAISPFLLLAVLTAAYAKAAGVDQLIARVFSGRIATMIVVAALFGALSPFCSCGVIPLVAALLAAGVPLAPVMAFWIASPIMDPEMFVLTVSALGLEFALAKTLAAIALGLASGFATLGLQRLGGLVAPLAGAATCSGAARALDDPGVTRWRFWDEAPRRAAFAAETRRTLLFLGKWLALAFALESLMLAYLPAEMLGAWLGAESAWAVPAAVLTGVPAYLNGYAAIPTVAGLLELGMAKGAALAFMTAGAVTSIPAAVAVWAVVRRPVFAWYIALALTGSAAVGYAFEGYVAM
jgi:uncharacterized membrane protein YraQ (UPF0718 family)